MTNYDILKEYEAHQTPVPSYEEWKALNGNMDSVIQTNLVLAKRLKEHEKICCCAENEILRLWNAKAQELLKDIRDSIAESQLKLSPEGFKLITEIVAKIDEVLK